MAPKMPQAQKCRIGSRIRRRFERFWRVPSTANLHSYLDNNRIISVETDQSSCCTGNKAKANFVIDYKE